ncbi:MAG: zinc-binding dehydrogenase [Candidatus Lokiarchaeota archaeon]|nr:zinc-binding dehydrogenase [Candidatus Lokiarchaeota archaeon]MBD3201499.1 zinc-binding dehydrogenase [Candidatus Lokiarchaeota archaeon]
MKAAYIEEHGDLDQIVINELPNPEPGPNDVIVDIKYAALNHIDIFIIKGWSGLNLSMPHILGSDGSGIIKDIGSEVTSFKIGDKVAINPGISCGKCESCLAGKQNFCEQFTILGENIWGTYAEYLKVPEINVLKIPEDFSLEKAAAAPLTFLTAWRMLTTQAKIKHNDFVFIHGAGGGVASAAIQISKYLNAKVIATTSSQEKMERAKMIGADYVINYKSNPDYRKYVYKEITKKKGIEVVIDSVGQSTFSTSIKLLNKGGRLITCGATTGPLTEIDLRYIFWKQLEIKGSTMSNQKEFRDIMKLIFEYNVSPIIDKVYSIEEIVDAEEYLKEAKQFGKILLKI